MIQLRLWWLGIFAMLWFSCGSDSADTCSATDLILTVSATNVDLCDQSTGVVELQASGGTGSYLYSIDGQNFQEENTFEGLSAGDYTVVVMDGEKCQSSGTAVVEMKTSEVVVTVEEQTTAGCSEAEGTVTLSASGGDEPYQFNIDDGDFSSNELIQNLETGTHTAGAQDANGCVSTVAVYVLSGVSLESQVMPIIESNCAISGCHGDTQAPLFTSKGAVISNASKIQERTEAGSMPPTGKLPDDEIALISCWVNDGAKNN